MMAVNVICVGKLKEAYWRDACAEYQKRLGAYCRFGVVELSEARLSQSPSEAEISAALKTEARRFEQHILQKGSFNVALCVEAAQITSEELSKKFDSLATSGISAVNFLIGSSFGLDEDIKKRCDMRLGISKMTLPHQLARVVLFEQIYRAMSISAGAKYHK